MDPEGARDPAARAATEANRRYYGVSSAGRDHYWRHMAAPRFRVETLLRLIAEIGPESIIDLGCGNGQLIEEIRDRHPRVSLAGLDLSPSLIAENRQDRPDVEWGVADLSRSLPAGGGLGGRFDAVIATEVIEHVGDPEVFLLNALRLARYGGRLLLSTQSGPVRETERRVGHVRHFSAEEMRGLLEKAGWMPARIWNCGFPFHDLSKWVANLAPSTAMAQFGSAGYGPWQRLACRCLRLAFRLNSRSRGAQLFAVAVRPPTPGVE